jgi:pimeloyl-ACP methyl ester carboxylesterase
MIQLFFLRERGTLLSSFDECTTDRRAARERRQAGSLRLHTRQNHETYWHVHGYLADTAPTIDPPKGYHMTRKTLATLCFVVCSCATTAAVVAQEAGLKKPSFDSDGVPIHYVVTGRQEGEPVVLIHGFAGSIEREWAQIIAALKKDFKVIALDCRGHGGSGKPHDPKKYGIEMANDVARLLDHLKIGKAHVVGYSMGAGIALSFAVHHPNRLRTLTVGGSGRPDPKHEKLIVDLADSLEKGNGFGPLIIALTPKNRPQPTPEVLKLIDKAVLSVNDPKALAAVARGALTKELRVSDKEIKDIRVPTLALIGADDPLRDGVDQLKQLLPMAKVVVIDKADHMTAMGSPEFIGGLRQFLDDNTRPTAK